MYFKFTKRSYYILNFRLHFLIFSWTESQVCQSVHLFSFFGQTTQAYSFILYIVVTHKVQSVLKTIKILTCSIHFPPCPKMAQKRVFTEYGGVIYHWKVHGKKISKKKKIDLPHPLPGPPKNWSQALKWPKMGLY